MTTGAVLIALTTLGAFFIQFNSGFSDDQGDWGSFGSYIGGVLGPLFAFLAFLAGMENLKFLKSQQMNTEILMTVRSYEQDLKHLYEMVVTCESPWVWGHEIDSFDNLKELPLRTLLQSDSIDWEYHLSELRDSLTFRQQPNGVLFQDRDIWLQAVNTIEGLFRYIDLYKKRGGDQSIIDYYTRTYEIPYNRLIQSS
ncbi:hypothetical protein K5N42_004623 [Vibrio parahaemolyticus]|nr:hypothetical protein [Vibrio parahaemolyticus]ELA8155829.1 hypothetical protein [Vibrio parahaemolyticus]ELM4065642.1 hypothetical protein [Vibrio parahaemolyticus]